MASEDGTIAKIHYSFESVPSPITLSMSQKRTETIINKSEQNVLEKRMQIGDFYVVRRLREGNFGKVYACWNSQTNKLYAIKVLDRLYV